ncbi:hypothetical protein AAMO2058_001428400 [Amorphochlora amoebiformis]
MKSGLNASGASLLTAFSDDDVNGYGLQRRRRSRRTVKPRTSPPPAESETLEVVGFCDCDEYNLDMLFKLVQQDSGPEVRIGRCMSDSLSSPTSKRDLMAIVNRGRRGSKTYGSFEMGINPRKSNVRLNFAKKTRGRGFNLDEGTKSIKMYADIVHMRIRSEKLSQERKAEQKQQNMGEQSEKNMADVFVISWGVIVCWNLSNAAIAKVRKLVEPCQKGKIKAPETEDMDYSYGLRRGVKNDVITLSADKEGEDAVNEKLAATLALAQSLKLSVLETRIDAEIDGVKHLPDELAMTGEITSLSRREVHKLLGKLFITHTVLTLTSDLLDTPQFFWEEDTCLPFYKTMVAYLEIPKRTSTLHKRKEVLHEFYEIVRETKESRQAQRLEWIVIWLIVAEVVLELIQILVGYLHLSFRSD